ncbi:MAG: 50S ribosomal protein L25 [Deltaproteobacteria bacterium]|nr:50S ribosomal protein L25 [Deltaproteobacteria bacterium]
METTLTLNATPRDQHGKGPARRLRASGKLPAIMYGPGETARSIAVDPKDIKAILAAPLGRNTVVTVSVEGSRTLAMLKGYAYHPLTRALEHADFYTVAVGRKIIVPVPFHTTGKSKGVATQGGILRQIYRTLPVLCTPDKIPAKIEADVTALELGQALHVRDLALPEGVAVKLDAGQTVVSIVAPEKEERAAEAAPGAAGAAPGAAAPAAAGAKDAKAPAAGAKDAKAAPAKDAKAAPAKDKKKK